MRNRVPIESQSELPVQWCAGNDFSRADFSQCEAAAHTLVEQHVVRSTYPLHKEVSILSPEISTYMTEFVQGIASYWSVRIGDHIAISGVWSYQETISECPKIKDLLCFFNERVDLYVDGELQARPQSMWSQQH